MRRPLLPLLLLAAACTPELPPAAAPLSASDVPEPVAAAAPTPAAAPAAPLLADADLHGRWRVVALNGAAPASGFGDRERAPWLVFSPGFYGGSSGCNSFGGMGVLEGDRFYASPGGQTAMGCGALTAQETAITTILRSSPRLSLASDGALTLSGPPGTMVLRRDVGAGAVAPAPAGTDLLAGSVWTIGGVDGRWLPEPERRTLRLEAERWSLAGACGTSGGSWRQSGDRIEARPDPIVTRACSADAAALDDALKALLSAQPRFATGPNGELLIGGGGHWATGERPRVPLADEAGLLAGSWKILAVDGAPPAGEREARIDFGPTGYSGSASCNSFQGYYLAHGRRLYSPPPMMTEMGCGPVLGAQERRVAAIVSGAPRIALAGRDGVALVAAGGGLRLRREAPAARWAPEGRIWTGTPLRAELTMFDGTPLQEHYSQPATRLRLSAQRFDIETGCGRLGGIWRRPRPPGHSGEIEVLTDPEPPPGGACAGALVRRLEAFMRLFNGRGRILVGASGELILGGEGHWLVGRVLR